MITINNDIDTLCYLVQRGKPCALVPLQNRYVGDTTKKIQEKYGNLFTYTEPLAEGWTSFWVYKYPYMLEVIKNLPEQPNSTFDHWVLGKAFGYSDESIGDFVMPL